MGNRPPTPLLCRPDSTSLLSEPPRRRPQAPGQERLDHEGLPSHAPGSRPRRDLPDQGRLLVQPVLQRHLHHHPCPSSARQHHTPKANRQHRLLTVLRACPLRRGGVRPDPAAPDLHPRPGSRPRLHACVVRHPRGLRAAPDRPLSGQGALCRKPRSPLSPTTWSPCDRRAPATPARYHHRPPDALPPV